MPNGAVVIHKKKCIIYGGRMPSIGDQSRLTVPAGVQKPTTCSYYRLTIQIFSVEPWYVLRETTGGDTKLPTMGSKHTMIY